MVVTRKHPPNGGTRNQMMMPMLYWILDIGNLMYPCYDGFYYYIIQSLQQHPTTLQAQGLILVFLFTLFFAFTLWGYIGSVSNFFRLFRTHSTNIMKANKRKTTHHIHSRFWNWCLCCGHIHTPYSVLWPMTCSIGLFFSHTLHISFHTHHHTKQLSLFPAFFPSPI